MGQKRVKICKKDGTEVDAVAPMILSVSRATDIPAFFPNGFSIDSMEGFQKVYSFQKHIDEWKEDYSCQIGIMDNYKKG